MTFFETIKCQNKKAFNLKYHQKRIKKTVNLDINLSKYIKLDKDILQKCKIIYDKNGILDISYTPYKPRDIQKFKLVFDDNIFYDFKSTNRKQIDNLFNRKDEACEIIIVKNNLITDTSIANIAIFQNNTWITPQKPLLFGSCLDRLLDEEILIQKDITIDELLKSEKIAILNAMIGFKIIENFDIINKNTK
jgi:4-amino-4-deoxychorismate lyase